MKGLGRRGEERGSSGSSRGIPNLVSPIPNASSDPYADEFTHIVEGETDPKLPYYKLGKKITYKRLFYNHDTKQYSLSEPKHFHQQLKTLLYLLLKDILLQHQLQKVL